MSKGNRTRWALVVALGIIALVCLPPSGPARPMRIDLCVLCGQNGGASALLNVVLYLPLGVALWWWRGRMWQVVALGALISLGVEVLQLAIPGRHTALSDLLANTLGAALGGALAIRPRSWLLPEGPAARIATAGATIAACGIMALAGLLFRPSAPPGDYYGQWQGFYGEPYDGRILDARLGDTPLPPAKLEDPEGIRALIQERASIRIRFIAGSERNTLRAMFRLVAGPYGEGTEALYVGVDGAALVLTPRFRADDARLSRPEVQIERAFDGIVPGDTVDLVIQARPDHGYDITLGEREPELVGFTVGHSWSLGYATAFRSGTTLRLMDHLWLLGLATAIGWCAPGRRAAAVALVAVLAVAGTTPIWSDLLPTPLTLYAALTAGLGAGVLLRRWASAQRRDGVQSS